MHAGTTSTRHKKKKKSSAGRGTHSTCVVAFGAAFPFVDDRPLPAAPGAAGATFQPACVTGAVPAFFLESGPSRTAVWGEGHAVLSARTGDGDPVQGDPAFGAAGAGSAWMSTRGEAGPFLIVLPSHERT